MVAVFTNPVIYSVIRLVRLLAIIGNLSIFEHDKPELNTSMTIAHENN